MKDQEEDYYMKIIYNFNKATNPDYYCEKHNLMMFLLSYFLAQQNISNNIFVYTDSFYKQILDTLGIKNVIEYNKTIDEKFFKTKHEVIYENLLQKEPFVFLDYDVFCFKSILFNSDITCYATEPDNFFLPVLPWAKKHLDIEYKHSYNTGILAFKNVTYELISYYKKYVLDMYKKENIKRYDMVVFDQYIFMNKVLTDKIVDKIDTIYNKDWYSFDTVKEKQICHLVGPAKKNPKLLFFIEQHLNKMYPDILKQVKLLNI